MLRQEQSARTRAAILDAAAEVFDAHGYQGAGLSEILSRAGVTRGAMYFHFASKEELARELIRIQGGAIRRHLSGDSTGLQSLIDLSLGLAQDLVADVRVRAGVRLVMEHASDGAPMDHAYKQWIDATRDIMQDAKKRGELVRGVSPDHAARFLVACFAGIQHASDVLTDRQDLTARFADLWRFVLPGLASSPESLRLRPRRSVAPAGGRPSSA